MDAYYNKQARVYQKWTESLHARMPTDSEKAAHAADSRYLGDLVSRYCAKDGRIVEVGCGTSRLRKLKEDREVVFIDRSVNMLKEARGTHAGDLRHFVLACGTLLPLKNSCASLVLCTFLLSHFPDAVASQLVTELTRIVLPGGAVILADSQKSLLGDHNSRLQLRHALDGSTYMIPKYYREADLMAGFFPPGEITLNAESIFVSTMVWTRPPYTLADISQ